jgi:phospholipid/cholesterol/gamma-HCH transport system substrate-binding protein
MLPQRLIEALVGVFLIFAVIAFTLLAFKVSGLTSLFPTKSYVVSAHFDEIGGLKVRSAVKVGGVQIGEVSGIELDPVTFKAIVTMRIDKKYNDIPDDSAAGILTSGLLGDNYIAITPMYSKTVLTNGSQIEYTHPAMVLEKLIGQLMYKIGNNGKDSKEDNDKSTIRNGETTHANE